MTSYPVPPGYYEKTDAQLGTRGPQKPVFNTYLTPALDYGNFVEMKGNYALSPTDFIFKPGPGEIYRIARVILYVQATGSFDTGFYGNGIVLINGLRPFIERDGERFYTVSGGQPKILTSGDVAAFCHDLEVRSWGQGDEFLTARWTLTRSGQYIRLIGDNNDVWGLRLEDDFSALNKHRIMVQGYVETGGLFPPT